MLTKQCPFLSCLVLDFVPTRATFFPPTLAPCNRGTTGNSNERAATSTSASQAADAPMDSATVKVEQVKLEACGDLDDDDDEMEQEEMFVEAYDSPSFSHGIQEWGGPRRGGRLPEPTRFGDWERKGRCSDF